MIRLGLVEMLAFSKLYYAGVEMATFMESCGVADLIATCYGGKTRMVAEALVKTGKVLFFSWIIGLFAILYKNEWYSITVMLLCELKTANHALVCQGSLSHLSPIYVYLYNMQGFIWRCGSIHPSFASPIPREGTSVPSASQLSLK